MTRYTVMARELEKLAKGGWEDMETNPSKGMSKKQKKAVVTKAKKGRDIGKKGKKFNEVAAKAAKRYGSAEAGRRVAAAAMWKARKG